jgi:hypothetical protein
MRSCSVRHGTRPQIELYIAQPSLLNELTEAEVSINWSCVGEVSIEKAKDFVVTLMETINLAEHIQTLERSK